MAIELNRAIIRLAHPLAFRSLLDQIGAPSQSYFRKLKLPALCEDPSAIVPVNRAWSLFQHAASTTDQDIGWRVGQHVGDMGLNGSIIAMLESAPTLNLALKKFIKQAKLEASHLQLGIIEKPNEILFYTHYPGLSNEPGYHVSQAYQLAVYVDMVQHFAGNSWFPPAIGIEASEVPECARELFPGTKFRVNQTVGYVSIPRKDLFNHLNIHHRNFDPNDRLVNVNGLELTDLLAILLKPYLAEGYPSMELAASLLDVSKRTLSRRLASCDKNFQQLIDEIRFESAAELLRESDRPISDIAWSVGFSDQGNFTRMFRRIAGISPRQLRQSTNPA